MNDEQILEIATKSGAFPPSYTYLFKGEILKLARTIIDESSKEVLKEFPLPALCDNERVNLDDFLRAGLL
jgi:hypothetical protein